MGITIGVLQPGYGAEPDYKRLVAASGSDLALEVITMPLTGATDSDEVLRGLGGLELLSRHARRFSSDVGAIAFACTSGSFIGGSAHAEAQRAAMQDTAGVPATSTSLAFVQACQALGYRRVGVAGTYPARLVDRFCDMLEEHGVRVICRAALGLWLPAVDAPVDPDSYDTLADADLGRLITAVARPRPDAVLIPDTALLSRGGTRFRALTGPPLVLANPVTIWAALCLAGWCGTSEALAPLPQGQRLEGS